MKSKKRWFVTALTACLTLSLGICAEALEYDFDGVEDTEYYPSTSYESLYGAKYNYGGSNATDYQWPALPYGVSSNTSVGCMEKVRFPGLVGSIGGSGIESNITNPIQQEPQIPSTSYQPSAYTSVDGMERKDGSMQDNENSEANMIVITTSKEERDKQFNDAMAKVMEQLEGPTLTRDNKERFKYEHFDYQYKTLKGYAGNQLSGGYKFPTGGGFYFSDSGGPNVSGSVSLSLPAPYNFVSISVGLGNRSTTSGLYVTVPNKTDYFKLYVEKEMEVRPYAIYKQNKNTREYELYDVGAVSVLYKLSAYAKKV